MEPVQLPVSLYDNPFDLASLSYDGYVDPPFVDTWSQYVPDEVELSPAFQQEWRRMEEEDRLAQAKSLATAPHYLIVNPGQYPLQYHPCVERHGQPTPPTSPLSEQNYILTPFGPRDSWGYQHAFKHPKDQQPSPFDLQEDKWRGTPNYIPLRDEHPGYPPESEEARMEGWHEDFMEQIRCRVNSFGDFVKVPYAESPHAEEYARLHTELVSITPEPHSMLAEISSGNNPGTSTLQPEVEVVTRNPGSSAPEPQPSHTGVSQYSEPGEPSLQSVVEVVTAHQASKKKKTRQKKPLILKTSKRKTRSETSDHDDEPTFYELDHEGEGKEVFNKKVKTNLRPKPASTSMGIKKTTNRGRARNSRCAVY